MTKVIDQNGLIYYTSKVKGITNGLQSQINDLKARGRFLSLWQESLGKPQTEPAGLQPGDTYQYRAGDYYLVTSVAASGGTNYKPTGTTYVVGSTSSTVETAVVRENDAYYFDGLNWILQSNTQQEVTFANIAGQPTDNANLSTALAGKVTKNNDITAGTGTKITYDTKGLVTSSTSLAASDIPNLTLSKITDVTATAGELNVLDGITASTAELNYTDGVTSNIQTQLDSKQPTLTAGSNIQISDNTISATDTTYTAGSGINIVGNVISSVQAAPTWGSITGTLASQTDLQTALNAKANTADLGALATKDTVNYETEVTNKPTIPTKISDLTDDTATNPIDKADTLTGLTATVAELNYVDGVTSNIQTQLDGKEGTLSIVSNAEIDAMFE